MKLKIISWNIWKGRFLDDVIAFLESQQADIICLQEITHIHETNINSAQVIASKLGYEYVFGKAFSTDRHIPTYDFGNATLFKLPLKSSDTYSLSTQEDYQQSADTEPRIALETRFEISGKQLSIFNVHLAYSHELESWPLRQKQVAHLQSLIPDEQAILVGDFNATPENPDIQPLLTRFVNYGNDRPTWSVYPTNYKGFVVKGLSYQIDYFLTTSDVVVHEVKVLPTQASDHLPMIAAIEV